MRSIGVTLSPLHLVTLSSILVYFPLVYLFPNMEHSYE